MTSEYHSLNDRFVSNAFKFLKLGKNCFSQVGYHAAVTYGLHEIRSLFCNQLTYPGCQMRAVVVGESFLLAASRIAFAASSLNFVAPYEEKTVAPRVQLTLLTNQFSLSLHNNRFWTNGSMVAVLD